MSAIRLADGSDRAHERSYGAMTNGGLISIVLGVGFHAQPIAWRRADYAVDQARQ